MPCCAVLSCRIRSQDLKGTPGKISFHLFPSDPHLKERWINSTGRKDWMPTKSSTFCSKHFMESDYIPMNNKKRVLKPGAIPTQAINILIDQCQRETILSEPSCSVLPTTLLKRHLEESSSTVDKRQKLFSEMSEAESQIEETDVKSEQTFECRACLQIFDEDCVLHNILEVWTSPWDGMENSIAEDLAKIAGVQISESDRHSKIICETCCQLLLSACSFTAIVKRNDEILRQRYGEDKTQINLSNDSVWPMPIQVDKLMASSMYENVDNKKEVVSDDEQYPSANESYGPSRDDLPILDIVKIEPEEIIQQQPSQLHVAVNGNEELDPLNTNESHLRNGNNKSERMESRIKRFVNLALTTEKSNISVVGISADKDATLSSGDARSNTEEANLNVDNAAKKRADLSVSNRHRCDSNSSSGSSSSDSSSSSSSSTNTFFNEDSDDSVKDPNYEVVEPQRDNQSSSDSDGEVGNVNKRHQDGLSHDIVIRTPTEDHEPILNSLVQEADAVPIVNEASAVENVRPTEQNSQNRDCSPNKKGKKRRRLEGSLKKNIEKRLKNSSKSYKSVKTKKIIPERKLRPPCRETCPFQCRSNITDDQRQLLLKEFWNLGDIKKQWSFIANSVETVIPKHRSVRVRSDGHIALSRENCNSFFFTVSGIKTKVCKVFFKNTLAINDWPIVTALKKKNKDSNISSMKDERGIHGNQYKADESIKNGVITFLEAIPKIESHYIRDNSRRHYIDGSKAIADLHRDYVAECKSKNVPFGSYAMFYRTFTQDYKMSFFVPQKDLCDVCEAYKNSTDEEKERLKENYETHQNEKVLSRIEKENDKKNSEILVAVYDFQAVFQFPKGDISFYYKSKLNVLNLTIYNIQSNCVENYVWDESNAHRGVNEIGTCIYKYLVKISETIKNLDVVFYSDNCGEQQKNEFMICMYLYAVKTIPNLNSVTHKYLIEGHTQNEGDSAHSQIEREIKRQLRSGPMYTPDAFIGAIKAIRKHSEPFHVNEMCFADFYDWKGLTNQMNFSLLEDENNDSVKLSDLKVIRVQKSDPEAIYFKDSYAHKQFKKAIVIKKKNVISNLELKNAYSQKPGISDKKKADLMDLVNKNLIPRYHRPFYESL